MFTHFYDLKIGEKFSMIVVPLGEVKGEKINLFIENGFKYNCIICLENGKKYYHFMVANELVKII